MNSSSAWILVSSVLFAGCQIDAQARPARGPQSAAANPSVRLAVNMTTVESAPVFLAARESPTLRIDLTGGGIPLLFDGAADLATNSETQALLRSIGNPNLRIILTVAECYYRLVARRSAGIQRVSDLRGKRVGTPSSTSAHYYLAKMLRTAKLSEADVIVVPLPVPDMASAIKKGDVDAVSSWEPGAQNAVDALGRDGVVLQDRSVYRELFNLNATTDALGDPAKRRAIVDTVRAIVRASAQVNARPKEVWPLVGSQINVAVPTIATVWRHFRFPAALPGDTLDVLTEEEQWVAALQKRAPRGRQALQSLIDDSVLRDARTAPSR